MARAIDRAERIYDVAALFAEECLIGEDSLLWPGREVWTLENLEQLWQLFILNPDLSDKSFIEKWSGQLSGSPNDIYRLATETTALYCLFPYYKQMGSAAKKSLIEEVRTMGPVLGSFDTDRWSLVEEALNEEGVGRAGTDYLTKRPFHIGYYLAFVLEVKRRKLTSLDGVDPVEILDTVMTWASEDMGFRPNGSRNAVLHLFWPDRYEPTASNMHKERMAKNLSERFGLPPFDDMDATILQARRHMEDSEGFPKDFDMYSDEVRPLWDFPAGTKSPDPPSNTIGKKFELAALFRERVLENSRSFLWPDDEDVWTAESAAAALNLIRPLAGLSYGDAFGKLVEIARTAPRPVFQIICDVRAASVMNRRLESATASRQMGMFFDADHEFDGDQQVLDDLIQSAEEYFPGIPAYHNKMINQVITVLTGILACIRRPEILGNRDEMCEAFLEEVPDEHEDFLHFPIWSQYFLLYPTEFASVPTYFHRQAVLRAFDYITRGQEFPNQMASLAFIRESLDPDFNPYTFDFYAEPWKSMWQGGSGEIPPIDNGGGESEESPEGPATPPTISDLAEKTYLDEAFLSDIESLLENKQQLIFEGPPGSGKTYVADQFARYFTGQQLGDREANEQIELVQFHQSYSYEDFIEGIRPETNNGQLEYNVKPGIFRVFAERAKQHPGKKFVLIIDEINRGNVSRILGELMLLLEYRHRSARLPYSQDTLSIPPNLYIIGTMNSADRSLSQIDYALRRRFYFVRFMAVIENRAPVLEGWLRQQSIDADTRGLILARFVALNQQLRKHLETDDLQVGHSYFMDARIGDEEFRKQVWRYAVVPLIREYLYHHRERDELLREYELQTLSSIVKPIADEMGESPEAIAREESVGEYE